MNNSKKYIIKCKGTYIDTWVRIRVARQMHSQTGIIPELAQIDEYITQPPELSEIFSRPKQPNGPLPDFYQPFHYPLKAWAEWVGLSVNDACHLITDYSSGKGEYGLTDHDAIRMILGEKAPFRACIDPITGETKYG